MPFEAATIGNLRAFGHVAGRRGIARVTSGADRPTRPPRMDSWSAMLISRYAHHDGRVRPRSSPRVRGLLARSARARRRHPRRRPPPRRPPTPRRRPRRRPCRRSSSVRRSPVHRDGSAAAADNRRATRRAPAEVRASAVYEFAARHPEVLRTTCRVSAAASAVGHKGNDDCFVAGRDAPRAKSRDWEPHGMICEICIDVAPAGHADAQRGRHGRGRFARPSTRKVRHRRPRRTRRRRSRRQAGGTSQH